MFDVMRGEDVSSIATSDVELRQIVAQLQASTRRGWNDPIPGRELGAMVILMVLLGVASCLLFLIPGVPQWVFPAMVGGSAVAWLRVVHPVIHGRTFRQTRASLLWSGYCASCAYPVRATPPDADGIVVCPECSAAWPVGEMSTAGTRPAGGDAASVADLGQIHPFWTWLTGKRPYGRTLDERDRALPLVDARQLIRAGVAGLDPRRDWQLRLRLSRGLGRERLRLGFWYLLAAPILVLVMWGILAGFRPRPVTLGWALQGGLALVFVVTWILVAARTVMRWWNARGESFDRVVRRAMLAEDLCPSCAMDLRTGRLGADGLVECTRCGAAWRPSPLTVATRDLHIADR